MFVAGYPYWNWSGLACAALYADGGPTSLAIHGTVYVPSAPVNLLAIGPFVIRRPQATGRPA